MKWLIALVLLGSLLANAGGFWLAKKLYTDENLLRLDPLQLGVYASDPIPKQAGIQRVVMFGDSRILSWPTPEVSGVEFLNRGIGQQTSGQIRLRFGPHVSVLQPDLVVLQLCVNDLKVIPLAPEKRGDIVAGCKQNLRKMIDQARALNSQVLVTTIFPLGAVPLPRQPFWSGEVASSINEVNLYINTLAAAEGVFVLDTFGLLQGEPDRIKPEYSRDLLHLNAEGYAVLNRALGGWLAAGRPPQR